MYTYMDVYKYVLVVGAVPHQNVFVVGAVPQNHSTGLR